MGEEVITYLVSEREGEGDRNMRKEKRRLLPASGTELVLPASLSGLLEGTEAATEGGHSAFLSWWELFWD